MARKIGDGNYTLRERKLLAKIAEKDAGMDALKAKVKVKDAVIRELRGKLGASK